MKIHVVSDYAEDFEHERRFDHQYRKNVQAVIKAASELGYDCEFFGGTRKLINAVCEKREYCDNTLFLNLTAGLIQDSRKIQAPVLFELLGVPFTGSGAFAHALANNKFHSKLAVRDQGICHTAKDALVTRYRNPSFSDMSFPLVVKPNCEGGSIGIGEKNLVDDINNLEGIIENTVKRFSEALVEEYVVGVDATCLLIGNPDRFLFDEVLVYETGGRFVQDFFIRDRETKHNAKMPSVKYLLQNLTSDGAFCTYVKTKSKEIFSAIGCRDIARIDYRITKDGELYFLEINSLPALSPSSPYVAAIRQMNLSFNDLVGFLIESACDRYGLNQS